MSTIDPFNTNPGEEAQQQTEPTTTPSIETSKEKPTLTTTTVSDQSKLTLTFKGGAGFDAPWVVVHANTPSEAAALVRDQDFKELLQLTQEVGGAFGGMAPNKPAQAAPVANAVPAGAQQAPAGSPECPPGFVFKSGISAKTGKPWKGFMPPRGSNEKPIFF